MPSRSISSLSGPDSVGDVVITSQSASFSADDALVYAGASYPVQIALNSSLYAPDVVSYDTTSSAGSITGSTAAWSFTGSISGEDITLPPPGQ